MNVNVEPIAAAGAAVSRRAADFLALTKPRLVSLVLMTTIVGFILGSPARIDGYRLLGTIFGTALAAAGALALNQYLERDLDARMARTRGRPLPGGRLLPIEALAFGCLTVSAGLLFLTVAVSPLAGIVTATTFTIYVFIYTPLKRRTSLATIVGAIPGALPPVTGWVAARGDLGAGAAALFTILFLWQLPHFLALAWLYREEFTEAGVVVLPASDPDGSMTGRQMVANLVVLMPATLLPNVAGIAGPLYSGGALLLGSLFLATGVVLTLTRSRVWARRVFLASLLYLPALLALLALDRTPLA